MQEGFFILEGDLDVTLNGETKHFHKDDFVFVENGVAHELHALTDVRVMTIGCEIKEKKSLLYPMVFKPNLHSVVWGGNQLKPWKQMPEEGEPIGESWEVSAVPSSPSIVDNGHWTGMSLIDVINQMPNEILGRANAKKFHNQLPLLVKFIDAEKDLSIQVHPDDKMAMREHGKMGKTEMWYSVLPTPTAYLYAGFNQEMDPDKFRTMVKESTIVDALSKYFTKPGDVFFLPAGRVHAIGEGNFVLEIQEASDITYRIYDYNRRDAQGNLRQLHVEESVDAINYNDKNQAVKNVQAAAGQEALVEDCAYFTTTLVNVDKEYFLPLAKRNSFTILISVKGDLELVDPEGRTTTLPQGQTVLVPADMPSVTVKGTGELVTVYIK